MRGVFMRERFETYNPQDYTYVRILDNGKELRQETVCDLLNTLNSEKELYLARILDLEEVLQRQ